MDMVLKVPQILKRGKVHKKYDGFKKRNFWKKKSRNPKFSKMYPEISAMLKILETNQLGPKMFPKTGVYHFEALFRFLWIFFAPLEAEISAHRGDFGGPSDIFDPFLESPILDLSDIHPKYCWIKLNSQKVIQFSNNSSRKCYILHFRFPC